MRGLVLESTNPGDVLANGWRNAAKDARGAMSPQRFVPHSYDASRLEMLQQVFDGTWELIKLTYPNRDLRKDDKLRTELAKEIAAHASTGVGEPQLLLKLALKRLLGTGRLR